MITHIIMDIMKRLKIWFLPHSWYLSHGQSACQSSNPNWYGYTDVMIQHVMIIIASNFPSGHTNISLKQGLKEFGHEGEAEVNKELDYLYHQKVLASRKLESLNSGERSRALWSLTFLEKKLKGDERETGCRWI